MRQVSSLRSLRKTSDYRLSQLEADVRRAIAGPRVGRGDVIAYCCIELLNTWTNFSRSYFLSCAFEAKAMQNGRISAAYWHPDVNALIGFAITRYKPTAAPKASGEWDRRLEPTWHDPNVLMELSRRLGFSNSVNIFNAFSLRANVFTYLPVFRNFFAHRNRDTEAKAIAIAARFGIPALRPSAILLSRPIGRPQPLLIDWIDEMRIVIEFLCD